GIWRAVRRREAADYTETTGFCKGGADGNRGHSGCRLENPAKRIILADIRYRPSERFQTAFLFIFA
ncbi:hypothetical protein, partial [Neisseria sp. oral taxon 020]|uniref:hypothetical protein n=1 Tax=Neisseria sp. oral taxon 020 TaxID=712401 RepID=UPI001E2FE64C